MSDYSGMHIGFKLSLYCLPILGALLVKPFIDDKIDKYKSDVIHSELSDIIRDYRKNQGQNSYDIQSANKHVLWYLDPQNRKFSIAIASLKYSDGKCKKILLELDNVPGHKRVSFDDKKLEDTVVMSFTD